jgi:hypothetical protein
MRLQKVAIVMVRRLEGELGEFFFLFFVFVSLLAAIPVPMSPPPHGQRKSCASNLSA